MLNIINYYKLKDKEVAVGGESMISTANYNARKYGVRSAMPTFIARELCPRLIVLPVNMEKYRDSSQRMLIIAKQYDSEYESMGLDEVSLDLTSYLNNH